MKVINLLNKRANRNIPKRIINEDYIAIECLNEEVVIIEDTPKEDKKIDKLNLDTDELRGKEIVRSIDYLLESKINEIIDRLNGEDNE